MNGLIIVGLMGLLYSVFVDGLAIIILFNWTIMLEMPSIYHDGLAAVCVLVGLFRVVESIYSGVSSFASAAIIDPAIHLQCR